MPIEEKTPPCLVAGGAALLARSARRGHFFERGGEIFDASARRVLESCTISQQTFLNIREYFTHRLGKARFFFHFQLALSSGAFCLCLLPSDNKP